MLLALLLGAPQLEAQQPDEQSAVLAIGFSEATVGWDGRARSYVAYRPASVDSQQPAPVLLALHGGAGTARSLIQSTGFDALADEFGFIVLAAEGVGGTWNAGTCCGIAARAQVDDVGFLTELVQRIGLQQRIDPDRIYAVGISNGGQLAYRLACEAAAVVVAVGVVATTMTSEPCLPEQPVAVVHIHGLADANIPFAGGVGPRARQRPPIDYVSVPATIERWRQLNGCPGEPETTQEGTVVRTASTGCAGGTSVVLYTIAGAGHAWPGGPPVTGSTRRVRDQPSDDLEASRVIWKFLDAHPRAQAPLTDGP